MSWLWNALASAPQDLVLSLLHVLGWAMNNVLVQPLLQWIVMPLLHATVFHPFSLTGNGIVARVAGTVWRVMAGASSGVALVAVAWGTFRRSHGNMTSGRASWGDIAEGGAIYAFVLVGGYFFLSAMLSASNSVTESLYQMSYQLATTHFNPALGDATGAAAALVYFFFPLSMLIIGGMILWVVMVWMMRQIDLVFYTGLLPITAALALAGDKRAFQWNWNEAIGAVFSQLAMALAWWIAWLFIGTGNLAPSLFSSTSPAAYGQSFLHMALGIVAMYLVGRAPSMLQRITGHQHAGVSGIAAGVAAGSLLARGTSSALRMSTGGALMSQMTGARQAQAQATLGNWAQGPSVGERFAQTRAGQGLKQLATASMSTAATAGQAISNSSIGRGIAGRAARFTEKHPSLAAGAAHLADNVSSGGRAAGRAITPVVETARTAGSALYQPRRTMGRKMDEAYAQRAVSEDHVKSHRAAAESGVLPPNTVQGRNGLDNEEYQRLMDTSSSGKNPPEFNAGAWQEGTYRRIQRAGDQGRFGPLPPASAVTDESTPPSGPAGTGEGGPLGSPIPRGPRRPPGGPAVPGPRKPPTYS